LRQSKYLTHPVFHMNRAESEMTRYMRRLADRDLALDRAMIPLGSCTMKLNATAEMLPIMAGVRRNHPLCRPIRREDTQSSSGLPASCARSPATTRSRCSRTRAQGGMRASDHPRLPQSRARGAERLSDSASAHGTKPCLGGNVRDAGRRSRHRCEGEHRS
jgi:hypothetical protein